jgi:hypothetical protein
MADTTQQGHRSVLPKFSQFSGLGLIPNSTIPNDRVPSYTLVNLRGGYWFWSKEAEVAVSVFNTFNDGHRESPIGDVIKSRVMGWFTLKVECSIGKQEHEGPTIIKNLLNENDFFLPDTSRIGALYGAPITEK